MGVVWPDRREFKHHRHCRQRRDVTFLLFTWLFDVNIRQACALGVSGVNSIHACTKSSSELCRDDLKKRDGVKKKKRENVDHVGVTSVELL